MGLFDRWRRKDKPKVKSTVKGREIMTPKGPALAAKPKMAKDLRVEGDVGALLAEHERLLQRREELQVERTNLTMKLDSGELEATEFRKKLMAMIQEAARVSDNIRENASKLTALGHPGVTV